MSADAPTTPGEGLEWLGNAIRTTAQADAITNAVKFYVRVLTQPIYIDGEHSGLLIGAQMSGIPSFDTDTQGNIVQVPEGHDPLRARATARLSFMGRILRASNSLRPHIYIRDPCKLDSTDLSNVSYVTKLIQQHTQFISKEGYVGYSPQVGDIVEVNLGRSDFKGPDLQVAHFDGIVDSSDAELYEHRRDADCESLRSTFASSRRATVRTCPVGADELPIVFGGARDFGYANIHGPINTGYVVPTGRYHMQQPTPTFLQSAWTTSLGTPSYWSGTATDFFKQVLIRLGANQGPHWGAAEIWSQTTTGAGNAQAFFVSSGIGSSGGVAAADIAASDLTNLPRLRFKDPWHVEQQKFFAAWADVEDTKTTNNPLATTWPTTSTSGYPGLTCNNCNPNASGVCNGVKNYATAEQGIRATANTLLGGGGTRFENIVKFLRKQLTDSSGAIIDTARVALADTRIHTELVTWGSGVQVQARLSILEGIGSTHTGYTSSRAGAPLAWVHNTTGCLCSAMSAFDGANENEKCGITDGNTNAGPYSAYYTGHAYPTKHQKVALFFNTGDVAALDYASRTRKGLMNFPSYNSWDVLDNLLWQTSTFYSSPPNRSSSEPPVLDPLAGP